MKKIFVFALSSLFLALGVVLSGCNDVGKTSGGEVIIKQPLVSTDSITFELTTSGDTSRIGLIDADLYLDDEIISSIKAIGLDKLNSKDNAFNELIPYTIYKLEISYDNGSKEIQRKTKEIQTLPDQITLESIEIINTNEVSVGDTVNLKITLNNPSNAIIDSILVANNKIDVSKDKVTNMIETSLVCNFIGEVWQIKVDNVSVKVNNLLTTFNFTEDNIISVNLKGNVTFEDFRIKDNPILVKSDENVILELSLLGEGVKDYAITSIVVNNKQISDVSIDIIDNNYAVIKGSIKFTTQGMTKVKLTKINLKRNNVDISSNLNFDLEIFVSTSSEKIMINSVEEFLSSSIQDGFDHYYHYELTCDLDFSGLDFTPIKSFNGFLNGNNHTIKGLKMKNLVTTNIKDTSSTGFIINNKGVITNLNFDNSSLTLTVGEENKNYNYGIVVGNNEGVIKYVFVNNASIVGNINNALIGGIAGKNSGLIVNSYAEVKIGKVIGVNNLIGGISGINSGHIQSVFTLVNIDDTNAIAGDIVGSEEGSSLVEDVYYYTGSVILSKSIVKHGNMVNFDRLSSQGFYSTLGWNVDLQNIINHFEMITNYPLGSQGNPILITTIEEFMNINSNQTYYYYYLANDLDFMGKTFIPLTSFKGVLDGGGHEIKGIRLESDKELNGLIIELTGIVKNLKMSDCKFNIKSLNNLHFGFIAAKSNNAILENIMINDCIVILENIATSGNSSSYIGSLVGYANKTIINNVASKAKITLNHQADNTYSIVFVGGISGYLQNGQINNVATNSEIVVKVGGIKSSLSYVGGIIGYSDANRLQDLYSQGEIDLETAFIKAKAGAIYGNINFGTINRNLHYLINQKVYVNQMFQNNKTDVHKNLISSTIEEIDYYNSQMFWGSLS